MLETIDTMLSDCLDRFGTRLSDGTQRQPSNVNSPSTEAEPIA